MSGALSGLVTSGSIVLLLVALPPATESPSQPTLQTRAATAIEPAAAPVPRRHLESSPYPRVSAERMLEELSQLTRIGAEGLWRTSGSAGERQAFIWLRERLGELHRLSALGAEVERQTFRIPLATEVWEARLELEHGGVGHAVPVHAMQGHRETLSRTLRFDTDGHPNDTARNPIQVDAAPTTIRSYSELRSLHTADLEGRVALVDYAVFDRGLVDLATSQSRAAELLSKRPAAVVLITSYSNRPGETHGSFAGDVSGFASLDAPAPVPTVFTRLEDLGPAGVGDWPDLGDVSKVTLRLDVDVLAPGESELTCLHIPGQAGDRVVILGAHLDSPNSPGALDDGSGSVALLEAARALDSTGRRPPVDTTMCWFGSEERGLYGSSVFVLSHQELVDHALGMLQVDCLGHAVEGLDPRLYLEQWTYGGWGNASTPLADFMAAAATPQGDTLLPLRSDSAGSDDASLVGFDVPAANLILMDPFGEGEVHVDNHLHDPYDTVALAAQHPAELEAMGRAYLAAALRLGRERPELKVTRPPAGRAVFVASHTEQPHMTPTSLTTLGMAMAWEQLDVDVVPYGHAVTADDLDGASIVVVLPVLDYPPADGAQPYDEAWSEDEVAALQGYASGGGLLVLTTSAYRLRQPNTLLDPNEDWSDANAVGTPLGVTYLDRPLPGSAATITSSHELVRGLGSLALAPGNGRAISAPRGRVLATAGPEVAATLVSVGASGGEVLALADLGMLGVQGNAAPNLTFWHNLARYARAR